MWTVTVLSIIGVVLNTYKRRECFMIWIVTNAVWMGYDWRIGAHEQAAMMGVYLVLSVWGLVKWNKEKMAKAKCPMRDRFAAERKMV